MGEGNHSVEYNEVERKVLKRLGRESFNHVTKDDIIKFGAMMPDLPPEQALKIIEQFPEFTRFASEALDNIENAHQSSLDHNKQSQEHFHEACQEVRAVLKGELDRDNLSPEERRHVLDLLMQILNLESAKDSENKQFIESLFTKVGLTVGGVVLAGLVFVGGRAALESAAKAAAESGVKAVARGGAKAAVEGVTKSLPK